MPTYTNLQRRCLTVLAALCEEHGWTLSDEQRQQYVSAITVLLTSEERDGELRKRLYFYHLDHDLVASLRHAEHPEHAAIWKDWCSSAVRIVRHTGFADADNPLLAAEDLAQIALEQLIRSLPNYSYRSRFTTWAYPIIVRAAQRQWEALQSAKRRGAAVSLQSLTTESEPESGTIDHPEILAQARALAELAQQVLADSKDTRLAYIFELWALHDQRLQDIAHAIGLNSSRISVLLKEARSLLQANQSIRAWADTPTDDDGE